MTSLLLRPLSRTQKKREDGKHARGFDRVTSGSVEWHRCKEQEEEEKKTEDDGTAYLPSLFPYSLHLLLPLVYGINTIKSCPCCTEGAVSLHTLISSQIEIYL